LIFSDISFIIISQSARGDKMRVKIFILGLALLLITPVLAQEEKEVINSFELIVNRIDKFFSTSQLFWLQNFL